MLPEAKICWFCIHMKREWHTDGRHRWRYACDLGLKKIGARHFVDFNRCKGFEPNPDAIVSRESKLHEVVRECRTELGYLERLSVYAEHRRRRGAEYHQGRCWFEPMIRETEEKTARACGFEQKEKRPDEGAGGTDEHI